MRSAASSYAAMRMVAGSRPVFVKVWEWHIGLINAARRMLGSLRISHNKFLWANKQIFILILILTLIKWVRWPTQTLRKIKIWPLCNHQIDNPCYLGTCLLWWFASKDMSTVIHDTKYPSWDQVYKTTRTQLKLNSAQRLFTATRMKCKLSWDWQQWIFISFNAKHAVKISTRHEHKTSRVKMLTNYVVSCGAALRGFFFSFW